MHAIFLYNPAVVQFDYGRDHPFRLERMRLTEYVCRTLGWFEGDGIEQRSFDPADADDLTPAHDSAYLDVLAAAGDGLRMPGMAGFGLASGDNPVFSGIWDYVLHTAGGSLAGASLVLSGETMRAFHPGGGLHHALRRRASGFCYVNDVVLAIDRMVGEERRVFYLDLDAHHGDGVQDAFVDSDRVLTLSVHQDGRTLFPGSGFILDSGRGAGSGYAVNVPLLPHMGDAEYRLVWDEIIEPLHHAFRPDLIVTELGADALRGDPLANLDLSLHGWWDLMQRIASWETPWLAVGGGGYDVGNALRAWSLAWGAMIGRDAPDALPPPPDRVEWPRDLWSAPIPAMEHAPSQEAIRAIIEQVKARVFAIHGL